VFDVNLQSTQLSTQPSLNTHAGYQTLRPSTELPLTSYGLPSIHIPAQDSRFYVKRRIIVGTVTKMVPKYDRGIDAHMSHRWMIYIRQPSPVSMKCAILAQFELLLFFKLLFFLTNDIGRYSVDFIYFKSSVLPPSLLSTK
jgi:hypothetical protein